VTADRSNLYWHLLSHAEQLAAVRRMAASRMSVDTIAGATALSVEQIRAILDEPAIPMEPPGRACCDE
jgi:hypothetical protein